MMTNKECIHDLQVIKEGFEKETNGCSPACLDTAIKIITDLPLPRKKGHWHKINPSKVYECSSCGGYILTDKIDVYRYCHHCGAEMTENEIEFGIF